MLCRHKRVYVIHPHDTDCFLIPNQDMKCRFYLWEEHEINKGFRASVGSNFNFNFEGSKLIGCMDGIAQKGVYARIVICGGVKCTRQITKYRVQYFTEEHKKSLWSANHKLILKITVGLRSANLRTSDNVYQHTYTSMDTVKSIKLKYKIILTR